MIDSILRCDGPNCTSVRGVTNHWLMAKRYKNLSEKDAWVVFEWDTDALDEPGLKHLCGVQCAHKLLDQYLDSLREVKCAA